MSREEEKYKAATESWGKQGFKNQRQKIPYKFGFLEGFDYADQHPSVDIVKKIICYALKNTSIMFAEDLENGVEWELLIKKAMKE